MKVPVSDAKAQLTELVRRAEAGEQIILTRFGRPAVRLIPVHANPSATERGEIIRQLQTRARSKATPGPAAARSQDFLYGDDGLPA